jgi:hypothetical protein
MEKSGQIAWKIAPLRHFFPLKVVPLIEVFLYMQPYMNNIRKRKIKKRPAKPVLYLSAESKRPV